MNRLRERTNKPVRSPSRTADIYLAFVLRASAYLFLAIALFILSIIAFEGSKALLKPSFPFLKISFLLDRPQTLHVYEPFELLDQHEALQAKWSALSSDTSSQLQRKSLQKEIELSNQSIKRAALTFSDDKLRKLSILPDPEVYAATSYAYSAGGIGPAIIGTLILIAGAILIAMPLGVCSAIFLNEFSRPTRTVQIIRSSIQSLSGMPSIVFGIFGFGIFVLAFGWGVSLLAGWITLSIMALPMIITDSEAALQRIPETYRESALALGASKWQSIRSHVLPYALPEILASSMLSVAKIAGETAPILFTAAFAFRDKLPWEGLEQWHDFLFQGVMALPYHIYVLSVKLPQNDYTRPMQYGAAFVFLLIVGSLAGISILLRRKLSQRNSLKEAS